MLGLRSLISAVLLGLLAAPSWASDRALERIWSRLTSNQTGVFEFRPTGQHTTAGRFRRLE